MKIFEWWHPVLWLRVTYGHYLIVISVIVSVLLLQQLPLSPLLLQGLLDERGHLALLTRTLSTNHKPTSTSVITDSSTAECDGLMGNVVKLLPFALFMATYIKYVIYKNLKKV